MNPTDKNAPLSHTQQSRRRALKVMGAASLAVPAIETLTGKDLLNVSAQAQTVVQTGVGGPLTGTVGDVVVV